MKMAFDGEWVSTSALSHRFGVGVVPRCELCRRLSYGRMWYSVKQKIYRCRKCFTPEILR
jgi:hypothetical protein